jgi:bifunctional non-homologous end joining protein LigD
VRGYITGMPADLTPYRAKRDPNKTPEPMGSTSRKAVRGDKATPPTFVIQEHHARSLHWDFRLEHDGVLVSWALPKGLPETPSSDHLAVHTEDHPLEYASFSGDIPKSAYGAGHVRLWDSGTYDLEKWRENEVMVVLHGARATGRYVLFPTHGKNWMIHRMDPPPAGYEPMPQGIRPMLAQPGDLPKSDKDWAYEFKWDGVRALIYVEGGRVRAFGRNGTDMTLSFPELRDIGIFVGARTAVLDGEIVSFDARGRPNFGQLSHRLHLASHSTISRLSKSQPVSYLAFDVLYLDGRNAMGLSYDKRRDLLESMELSGDTFGTPPSIRGERGAAVLAVATERGLEGVVVKRRRSTYTPGRRTGDWVKVKIFHTQEVVIGGWTPGKGQRSGSLGALLLGIPTPEGLEYAGKVGTGFTDSARSELLTDLAPLAADKSPFREDPGQTERAQARFVRPDLVGEVRFAEWTKDGHLRHPSWRGLRPDKSPNDVVREA